ncbi:MAG: hypothetical protein O2954_12815, partial [bacterium]|nr:hypothetical protein [bacterium]
HRGTVDHVVISDGANRTFGEDELTTDALCAVVRTRTDGTYLSHSVVSGRRLIYKGQPLGP